MLELRREPGSIARIYSQLGPLYDFWPGPLLAWGRDRTLELAAIRPGQRVLEVPTGTGLGLRELALRNCGGRTVGVELASGMLALTRRRMRASGLAHVEVVAGDALRLPFAAECFDVVVSRYLLCVLPREDIGRALAECRRVLRPGGRLVVACITKGERPRDAVWDALYARGLHPGAIGRGVLARPALRELGGFDELHREYYSGALFPSEVVSARKTGAAVGA